MKVSQSPKTTQTMKKSTSKYPHLDLLQTLFYMEDVLDRAQVPFLVLKDTAKSVYEESDLKEPIHIGIMRKHLMKANVSTLKSLLNGANFDDGKLTVIHNNIPIYIDIIDMNLSFFKYPDFKFYYITQFRLPNPFPNYYRMKDVEYSKMELWK